MCGLAGIINRRKYSIKDKSVLEQMLKRIAHRGPDDNGICGFSKGEHVSVIDNVLEKAEDVWGMFGFNRLSIQDITPAGHQPMLSNDGKIVLTFNGEIYNVKELRSELASLCKYQFRGSSDTEVILYMYQEYGFMNMVKRLNGMFAIVLYDTHLNTIFFARDRFGIIPLHVYVTNDEIVYSSEIKAFLEYPNFKRELSLNSVLACLTYGYPNNPLHENIENIQPGTVLQYSVAKDELKTVRFFDIDQYSQREYSSKYDYIGKANDVLGKCVRRQLISDVNLGVQLSGGVDSTLLSSYVSDVYSAKKSDLYGFSMTNHDTPRYDEEKYIDYAASLNNIILDKTDLCFERFIECLEHSIYAFERPFYSLPPVGIYLFSKEAKKKVTVLISGEGADELCGGYSELFVKYKYFELLKNSGQSIPPQFDSVDGRMEFIEDFDKIQAVSQYGDLKFDACLNSFLNERKTYWDSLHGTAFDKLRKMHFKYRLISMLERQNKVCMANSIENRVPFLDNEFVELMFSLPEQLLMHPKGNDLYAYKDAPGNSFDGKYLLKQMNADKYGNDFAFRKKQAIYAPLGKYLSNPKMLEYINEVISPSIRKRGLIDINLFNNRLKNLSDNENVVVVWKYINMELWFQYFVDGRVDFYASK